MRSSEILNQEIRQISTVKFSAILNATATFMRTILDIPITFMKE